MTQPLINEPGQIPRGRLIAGLVLLFGVNLGLPLIGIPLLTLTALSTQTKALLSGVFLATAELSLPLVIAVLGKSGFAYLKQKAFGWLKKYGPPQQVSRTRYRIGLCMFVAPLLLAWVNPYLRHFLGFDIAENLTWALLGDVTFFASVFVLGGDFWEKIRGLFIHDATVPIL